MAEGNDKKLNPEELIKKVTDMVQSNADTKVIFGEAVKEDGITIIPVGKVSIKGGGGGGFNAPDKPENGKTKKGSGMGLGLNVENVPLGYIKIIENEAEFVEILDKTKIIVASLVAISLFVIFGSRFFRK